VGSHWIRDALVIIEKRHQKSGNKAFDTIYK